jgi:hypothetical protein
LVCSIPSGRSADSLEVSIWIDKRIDNMFISPWQAGIGGPLVNLDGDIIGMNFYSKKIGTPFLLWKEIANILEYFKGKWYAHFWVSKCLSDTFFFFWDEYFKKLVDAEVNHNFCMIKICLPVCLIVRPVKLLRTAMIPLSGKCVEIEEFG